MVNKCFLLQLSCFKMAAHCDFSAVQKLLRVGHDVALLEQSFIELLQSVRLGLDELGAYFKHSLPSPKTVGKEKLWAFYVCNCADKDGRQHYIAKKCDECDDILTINFQIDCGVEITNNNDHD